MKLLFSRLNIFTIFFIFSLFFSGLTAIAAPTQTTGGGLLQGNVLNSLENNTKALQDKAGYEEGVTVGGVVAGVVRTFLALLGIIFVILIILAGYNWMTAAGDEEKITKAKDTIRSAVIGLIIVVAAYSITYFIFENLPGGGGEATVTP